MPGWIEVTLKNETRHTREIPEVRGNARSPIDLKELLDKFHTNTSFLGASVSSRIADDILALDTMADVNGFMTRVCESWAAASVV